MLVDRLSTKDIPENLELAHSVGWADTESDWRVVHAGALVLGVRNDERLVAQGALGLYDTAGTVAKMIVDPSVQRQGLGMKLLDALLEEAESRSISVLGLTATPFGRPVYERRDFVAVGEVVVLTGTPELNDEPHEAAPIASEATAPNVEALYVKCSRATVLQARFRHAIATAALCTPDGQAHGYAMATSQSAQALVGPVIARNEADARALTRAIFAATRSPVRIDVPGEQTEFRKWLTKLGLRELGVRPEMARGAARLPWQVPERFALAAQAWG